MVVVVVVVIWLSGLCGWWLLVEVFCDLWVVVAIVVVLVELVVVV